MKNSNIRVRFAPSPTGSLHIGGARTALFNWLFARHSGGSFILRIEDTDEARSTEESTKYIYSSLEWLGLDWDEGPVRGGEYGPYTQMERLEYYTGFSDILLEKNLAYRCYCSAFELAEKRKKAMAEGRPPKYDRSCFELCAEDEERLKKEGKKPVVRFRISGRDETAFRDLVRGDVSFKNAVLDDFVIMKSTGAPAFNFANVVDDHLMKISHVIRGDEHLSNTPRQILLYEALGFDIPEFAHLPMILGSDGAKLSKRHGAASVQWFRDEGFLPEALVNYLALLGWGTTDSQQIFGSPGEMVEKFSLERVSRNPAVFDMKKLEWMNGYYIRNLSPDELASRAAPYLEERGLLEDSPGADYVREVVLLEQERIKKLSELAGFTDFFFRDEIEINPGAWKLLQKEGTGKILEEFLKILENHENFDKIELERATREFLAEKNIRGKDLMQPVRAAITGRKASPGLFEVMELLGREKVIERIRKAVSILGGP